MTTRRRCGSRCTLTRSGVRRFASTATSTAAGVWKNWCRYLGVASGTDSAGSLPVPACREGCIAGAGAAPAPHSLGRGASQPSSTWRARPRLPGARASMPRPAARLRVQTSCGQAWGGTHAAPALQPTRYQAGLTATTGAGPPVGCAGGTGARPAGSLKGAPPLCEARGDLLTTLPMSTASAAAAAEVAKGGLKGRAPTVGVELGVGAGSSGLGGI